MGKWKTVAKTFTWRAACVGYTFALVAVTTGHYAVAVGACGIEFFVKAFLYYAHERAWEVGAAKWKGAVA